MSVCCGAKQSKEEKNEAHSDKSVATNIYDFFTICFFLFGFPGFQFDIPYPTTLNVFFVTITYSEKDKPTTTVISFFSFNFFSFHSTQTSLHFTSQFVYCKYKTHKKNVHAENCCIQYFFFFLSFCFVQ